MAFDIELRDNGATVFDIALVTPITFVWLWWKRRRFSFLR